MYTFPPMMVANSQKHHCRVRSYTQEVLVISTNLNIQKNHYPLDFRNRRGDEARIKNTCWVSQELRYCAQCLIIENEDFVKEIAVCLYIRNRLNDLIISAAAVVASPVGVLELDTHSSSKADPSESSLPLVSVAPMVLPFLCSDDLKSDTEMPGRCVSPTPHDVMLPRWRSRDIPIGQLYHTHPSRPCRALTARKSVRPLPSHRLALRYTSHHLDRFTSESSSDHSSSDHSSSGYSTSGHSSSGHTPLVTTIADSSTPSRFVYPPLTRTLWYSKAYRRWRSSPLSTMYLPTTSESSVGDSSFETSTKSSRKRCRSPTATVTLSIPALGALVPSRTDLLPPCKRFRDSISPEDSVEDDIDADVLTDVEADATAIEVAADMDVEVGVDVNIGMEVDVGVDIEDEVEGEVESSDRGTIEVGVDVVAGI
ncbi:hypothetical protein Tco_0930294, partial [Tanacetum coccineum]